MKLKMLMAATGLALATCATAQPVPPPGGWNGGAFWRGAPDSPRDRIHFLQDRIDRGIADGSLSRGEARRASGQLDSIRRQDMRMHYRDGRYLDPRDRDMIQRRLDDLSSRIRWMRHNGW